MARLIGCGSAEQCLAGMGLAAAHERLQLLLADPAFPAHQRHETAVALDVVTRTMERLGLQPGTVEEYRSKVESSNDQ